MITLTPVMKQFILHWGEMGTRWGINRTVAQVHALLYISPKALHAEEIAEALDLARSNVSTSLKELRGWGIIRVVHVMGDRRDHFESLQDVWELFRQVLDERKRREIDPTLELLRQCVTQAKVSGAERQTQERLIALEDFFQTMSTWYVGMRALPMKKVLKLVSLGRGVGRLLGSD